MRPEIKEFMDALKAKTVGEVEFHQAVEEVIETVWDTYQANPKYKANKILEKMVEPERVIMFRVPWIDDKGEVRLTVVIVCNSTVLSDRTKEVYVSTRR